MFLGDVCKRKPWREGEERLSDREFQSFSNSYSSVSKRQKRGEAAEASDMQVCKNDAVWGPLSPQKPNTAPFWDHFPYQSPHDAVLGTKFPTKFPTLDPPIFLSFLVSLK